MSKPKPTALRGLYDAVTMKPVRDALFGSDTVVCPECGQRWKTSYALTYFEYCYTCGCEVNHE